MQITLWSDASHPLHDISLSKNQKLMKQLIIVFALLFSMSFQAQTEVRKPTVSSGGGRATSGNVYMAYAIGEVSVREADAGNIHLSEGFIGPDLYAIMGIEDYKLLKGVQIYPSPVITDLNIRFSQPGAYEISMFDLTGKLVHQVSVNHKSHEKLDLRNLNSGIYLLVITNHQNKQAVILKFQKR